MSVHRVKVMQTNISPCVTLPMSQKWNIWLFDKRQGLLEKCWTRFMILVPLTTTYGNKPHVRLPGKRHGIGQSMIWGMLMLGFILLYYTVLCFFLFFFLSCGCCLCTECGSAMDQWAIQLELPSPGDSCDCPYAPVWYHCPLWPQSDVKLLATVQVHTNVHIWIQHMVQYNLRSIRPTLQSMFSWNIIIIISAFIFAFTSVVWEMSSQTTCSEKLSSPEQSTYLLVIPIECSSGNSEVAAEEYECTRLYRIHVTQHCGKMVPAQQNILTAPVSYSPW